MLRFYNKNLSIIAIGILGYAIKNSCSGEDVYTKAITAEECHVKIDDLKRKMLKYEETHSSDEKDIEPLFRKTEIVIKDLDKLSDFIEKGRERSIDYDEIQRFDCGCGFPNLFGNCGPIGMKVKYLGKKRRKQLNNKNNSGVKNYVSKICP